MAGDIELALMWLAFTYSAMKLASMARVGGGGFRRHDISFLARITAREPWLFAAAATLSVPLALMVNHDAERNLTDQFEEAATCYGRLLAFKDMPSFKAQVGDVYDSVQLYQNRASAMAAALKIKPDAARKALTDRVEFHAARYAMLQKHGMQREIEDEVGKARSCRFPDQR